MTTGSPLTENETAPQKHFPLCSLIRFFSVIPRRNRQPQLCEGTIPLAMPNRVVQWAAATALILCLVGPAVAQQVPNAGSILRQLEPEQPNLPVPKEDSSRRTAPAAASGPVIHVRAFRIDGNRLVPTAQIL